MLKKKISFILSTVLISALCACNIPDISSIVKNEEKENYAVSNENNNQLETGINSEDNTNNVDNNSSSNDSDIITNAENYSRVYVMEDDDGGRFSEPYIYVNFNKDGYSIDLQFLGTGVYLQTDSTGKTPTSGEGKIYDYRQDNGDVGGEPSVMSIYMEYSDTQIKLYWKNVETDEFDMEYPMVFNYSNTIS